MTSCPGRHLALGPCVQGGTIEVGEYLSCIDTGKDIPVSMALVKPKSLEHSEMWEWSAEGEGTIIPPQAQTQGGYLSWPDLHNLRPVYREIVTLINL